MKKHSGGNAQQSDHDGRADAPVLEIVKESENDDQSAGGNKDDAEQRSKCGGVEFCHAMNLSRSESNFKSKFGAAAKARRLTRFNSGSEQGKKAVWRQKPRLIKQNDLKIIVDVGDRRSVGVYQLDLVLAETQTFVGNKSRPHRLMIIVLVRPAHCRRADALAVEQQTNAG